MSQITLRLRIIYIEYLLTSWIKTVWYCVVKTTASLFALCLVDAIPAAVGAEIRIESTSPIFVRK